MIKIIYPKAYDVAHLKAALADVAGVLNVEASTANPPHTAVTVFGPEMQPIVDAAISSLGESKGKSGPFIIPIEPLPVVEPPAETVVETSAAEPVADEVAEPTSAPMSKRSKRS